MAERVVTVPDGQHRMPAAFDVGAAVRNKAARVGAVEGIRDDQAKHYGRALVQELHASGLLLKPIGDDGGAGGELADVHAAARLTWLPDFDFLDPATLFEAPPSDRDETVLQEELGLLLIAESAHRGRYLAPCAPHFAKFRDWLNQQVGAAGAGAYELVKDAQRYTQLDSGERLRMIGRPDAPIAFCAASISRMCAS